MNAFKKSYKVVEIEFSTIEKMMVAGSWRLDLAFQREFTAKWNQAEQQIGAMESLLAGRGVGMILINKDDTGAYWLIDGKQRSGWLTRCFAHTAPLPSGLDWVNPEFVRAFAANKITAHIYDNLTEEDCAALFSATNGGQAGLSGLEIRRAELLPIYGRADVKVAVSSLMAVMHIGKNEPKRSTVEEILLLNVYARMGGRDYLAKTVVPFMTDAIKTRGAQLQSACVAVTESVYAFCEDWSAALVDGKPDRDSKRLIKKGFLNVIFNHYKAGVWLNVQKFSRCLLAGVCADDRKEKWDGAIQAAAASSQAVETRLMLVADAVAGLWVEKEVEDKTAKTEKTGDKTAKTEKRATGAEKWRGAFEEEYGKGDYKPEEVDKILAYVDNLPLDADPKFIQYKAKGKDGIYTVPAVQYLGVSGKPVKERISDILSR